MATLAKNTSYYTVALTFQKVLSFLYFTFIARVLGPELVGQYVTAISFTTLFTVFVDVGLSPLLIREVAKNHNRTGRKFSAPTDENVSAKELLGKMLSIKIPLAILSYIVIIAVAQLMGYPTIIKQLIYVAGIVMLLDSFSLTFWAVIRGFQTLKKESINVVIFQIILVSLGGFSLWMGYGILPLIFALLTASTFQFFFSSFSVATKHALPNINLLKWRADNFRSLVKISLPFALAGIFTRIYTSFDTVMISKMIGDDAVGWYSIPIKIVLAFQFLPMAFIASLYPAMSAAYSNRDAINRVPTDDRLANLFTQGIRYLILLGFPIGFGITALAGRLIVDIWTPEFLPALWPMRILMAGLIILFLSFPIGSLLNATNRQMINTKNIGIMLAVNVALNFILIPLYGITGAAIASFVASCTLLILNLRHVQKIITIKVAPILGYAFKVFTASLVMAVAAWYMEPLSLFLVIPIAAIIYTFLIFATRAVTKQDILTVKNIFP